MSTTLDRLPRILAKTLLFAEVFLEQSCISKDGSSEAMKLHSPEWMMDFGRGRDRGENSRSWGPEIKCARPRAKSASDLTRPEGLSKQQKMPVIMKVFPGSAEEERVGEGCTAPDGGNRMC